MSELLLPILSGIRLEMEMMNKSLAQMNKTHVQILSEDWATPAQVMFTLKICKRTLENLKGSGQLPFTKINGLTFFRTVDVEQLLELNYRPSSTNKPSTFHTKDDERK